MQASSQLTEGAANQLQRGILEAKGPEDTVHQAVRGECAPGLVSGTRCLLISVLRVAVIGPSFEGPFSGGSALSCLLESSRFDGPALRMSALWSSAVSSWFRRKPQAPFEVGVNVPLRGLRCVLPVWSFGVSFAHQDASLGLWAPISAPAPTATELTLGVLLRGANSPP